MNPNALVQCVPNFSEGRRPEVIEAIAGAIAAQGVRVLSVSADADHNRCVITFVGEPGAVAQAAIRGAEVAMRLIDLNQHRGNHPRMGAVDVIPFVPISGCDMADCVALARRVGEALGNMGLPVFLYEEAATRPDRRNLADVRRGEFEGLREQIGVDPAKKPDFGPEKIHPTAGCTAVGARMPLIAFNVNLGTSDLSIAKKIAKAVRGSSGGLVHCKALGIPLADRGQVQVSMNMVNYKETPLHRAFELIKLEAERYGVPVVGSEIVGLVPVDALVGVARHYLRLEGFKSDQVLEKRLVE
ncbi:glutamate formiminotransferase [Symbiobacterium terraclitae]|uniref:glutamate formimidoyltransferase n=1 Tax=Symbiobacterium terraclitae TaxID=557451 RepID=A0ABS4JXC6_9FIRM|nr:glutamate formimidoyltransferase [Symbiobacterium terraclitae]MBP2020183.1 glutamate formiminotransferase [Symbiobacterium terraclitae]